jgi:hypothetical protein
MKLEDLYHFQVGGNLDDGDASISLTCTRCTDFHVWIEVGEEEGPTLAALEERAEVHAEHGCGS